MIYLDNAATTKIDSEVFNAMLPYLKDLYGNPGSLYELGRKSKDAIDKAREQVADLIGCDPEQVIFTSGGSEANNLAVKGGAWGVNGVCSPIEHDSVMRAFEDSIFTAGTIPLDRSGIVTADLFWDYIERYETITRNEVEFASVMYVNNETGNINQIREISEICQAKRIIFHTDCVQALGGIPINVTELGCDLASFSSHKIHGPKGVGCLFTRYPEMLSPIISGGHTQEYGLRGGTENVAGIVGFGEACRIAKDNFDINSRRVQGLRHRFLECLRKKLYDAELGRSFHINTSTNSSPKVLSIRFDGIDAQTLVLLADTEGLCISAGSACRAHDNIPSATLVAMGLSDDEAKESVRVSFSADNTIEEIDEAAEILVKCVSLLHKGGYA